MAFMVMSLVACGSDDDEGATMNIVETAVADGRFTTLVAALQAAELDDDLAGDGPFTVFAPTDDAFDKLPAGTVDFLLTPAAKATLIDILTFHVFSGDLRAADVASFNGTAANMLNSKDLRIDVIEGKVILSFEGDRQAEVIITDILATNGVIHVIDAVLNPDDATSDIVQTAVDNGKFTLLAAALTKANLIDTLKDTGPFTVFAPTDDAFNAIGINTANDLPDDPALGELLKYHVFDGSVLATAAIALSGNNVTMLNGDLMSIDFVNPDLFLNQGGVRAATVVDPNVLASNGVIHVINTVLDPADAPVP